MLLAAAMRAGTGELRVFLAGEGTLDARPPEGMDLPAPGRGTGDHSCRGRVC
jgi:hypothetical protein